MSTGGLKATPSPFLLYFWKKLLCAQIIKEQKIKMSVFYVLLGFAGVKAARKMLVKLTQGFDLSLVCYVRLCYAHNLALLTSNNLLLISILNNMLKH